MRAIIFLYLSFFSQHAYASDIEIQMLNKLDKLRMTYSVPVAKINTGDTIKWIATDKSHNVEFIKDGTPAGVEPFKSPLSQDAEYTFTIPGIYAYKCSVHFTMGMIGFIVVGDNTENIESVKALKYPGQAKKVAEKLLAEIQ